MGSPITLMFRSRFPWSESMDESKVQGPVHIGSLSIESYFTKLCQARRQPRGSMYFDMASGVPFADRPMPCSILGILSGSNGSWFPVVPCSVRPPSSNYCSTSEGFDTPSSVRSSLSSATVFVDFYNFYAGGATETSGLTGVQSSRRPDSHP